MQCWVQWDAVRGPVGRHAAAQNKALWKLLDKEGYVMVENLFPRELSSAPESQSGVGTIKKTPGFPKAQC